MSDAYQQGRDFFRRHLGATKRMAGVERNPYWRVKQVDGFMLSDHMPEYDAFNHGVSDAEAEYIQSDLGVAEFLRKLRDLCDSHGVEVSSGCGCCGAGGSIVDLSGERWDFSF